MGPWGRDVGLWDHGAVMWGCGAVMFRGHGMGLWGHGALGAGWVSFGHIVSVKQSLEKRETEAAVECTPESCSPCGAVPVTMRCRGLGGSRAGCNRSPRDGLTRSRLT